MAARLGRWMRRARLLLGPYYGGTGWGISLSALLVPAVLAAAPGRTHRTWPAGAGAGQCRATLGMVWPVRVLRRMDAAAAAVVVASGKPALGCSCGPQVFRVRDFGLRWRAMRCLVWAGTGYMTFVVALCAQGARGRAITGFMRAAGAGGGAVVAHLGRAADRSRAGRRWPSAGTAWLAWPFVLPHPPAHGRCWPGPRLLFGGVFLSASLRPRRWCGHNLPPSQWAVRHQRLTHCLAAGQIVGPTVVGLIADGPGGLALAGWRFQPVRCGWRAVGWRQRPLAQDAGS